MVPGGASAAQEQPRKRGRSAAGACEHGSGDDDACGAQPQLAQVQHALAAERARADSLHAELESLRAGLRRVPHAGRALRARSRRRQTRRVQGDGGSRCAPHGLVRPVPHRCASSDCAPAALCRVSAPGLRAARWFSRVAAPMLSCARPEGNSDQPAKRMRAARPRRC
jgi:hypothetical protein